MGFEVERFVGDVCGVQSHPPAPIVRCRCGKMGIKIEPQALALACVQRAGTKIAEARLGKLQLA